MSSAAPAVETIALRVRYGVVMSISPNCSFKYVLLQSLICIQVEGPFKHSTRGIHRDFCAIWLAGEVCTEPGHHVLFGKTSGLLIVTRRNVVVKAVVHAGVDMCFVPLVVFLQRFLVVRLHGIYPLVVAPALIISTAGSKYLSAEPAE